MNEWIGAAIAVAAGIVIGGVLARIVRRAMGRSRREALRSVAGPCATFAVSACVVAGLVVALGIVNPESLETIPDDLVDYLPRVLAAAVVLIGGNVVASVLATAAQRALAGAGPAARVVPNVVRVAVLVASAILAASQLGVDTTVVNIAVAALAFGLAGAAALLTGLGGREVAGEVAAGRASRQLLAPGDRVRVEEPDGLRVQGTVVRVHPTVIELEHDGHTLLVPHSRLLHVVVERGRDDA